MKDIRITVDKRCCNEQQIDIESFQNKIQENLSQYSIDFMYDDSPTDSFCEKGYTAIGFLNISNEEQAKLVEIIDNVYNKLIKI